MKDTTLPPKGGWIMLTSELPTVIQPPVLSMWYAIPERVFPEGSFEKNRWLDEFHYMKSRDLALIWRYRAGNRNLTSDELEFCKEHERVRLEQRVKITTPWGDVCVEPYEWSPIPNIGVYFEMVGSGVIMH